MATVGLGFELTPYNCVPAEVAPAVATRSLLECAALCVLDTCLAVVFDSLNQHCFINANKVYAVDCATLPNFLHVVSYNKLENDPQTAPPTTRCPPALWYVYEESLDMCYKHHALPLAYKEATDSCLAEGGTHMLRVDNLQKDNFLFTTGYGGFIEGKFDGSDWKYADGTNLTYQNWATNEPLIGRDCIMKTGTVGWSSVPCVVGLLYSCEYRV